MPAILLAQKTINGPNLNQSIVFDGTDIQRATGYATLQGPFSLLVFIDSNALMPLFFGISITSMEGVVQIADRQHLGYIPASKSIVVSPSSTPPLGNVAPNRQVTSIKITFYATALETNFSNVRINTALWFDNPIVVGAISPIIGADLAAYETGDHFNADGTVSVLANTTNTIIASAFTLAPYRQRIKDIYLGTYPTVWPGDLSIRAQILDLTGTARIIGRLRSEMLRFNTQEIDGPFFLATGETLEIRCDNNNPSISYNAFGGFYATQIY